jgi:protein arginine kinase activator
MDQSLDEKHPTPGSVSGIGSASGIIQPTSLASLTAEDIECDHCGLSYVNYRNTLILGCTHCYESFKDRLMNDLHRMHGAIKHTGRHPTPPSRAKAGMDSDFVLPKDPVMMVSSSEAGGLVPKVPSIAELKDSLQNAIDREEFELAAKLRDEIRRLEIDLKETDAS